MNRQSFDAQGHPVNQFGTPVGPPAVPTNDNWVPQAAYPAPPYASGFPAPRRTGLSTGGKVAVILGACVAGIVVLAILAAVAIPVFLNQRARAEAGHISVSLPATVAGYPKLSGSADASIQNIVAALPAEASSQGAVYGSTRPFVVVIVGHHVMLPKDRSTFLNGVARSEHSEEVAQIPVDPGPLGGEMRCGTAMDLTHTDCAFADAGAFGVIDVALVGPKASALVQQVRAQVEQRH